LSLSIQHITKYYRDDNIPAISGFTAELEPGIVGLLGPNGSGKSTLMRIIATITKPSKGTILWNNDDISKKPDLIRKDLGYLPQDFGVYPNLNADEFLQYLAALKGVDSKVARKRIEDLLTFVNLIDVRKQPLRDYSGGMKQRIGIAQALLNDPKILIVDEPTVGLDTEVRIRFRHLLAELSGERVIILSTHIVPDVEAIANDIIIISKGHLIKRAASEELIKLVDGKVWEWIIPSTKLAFVKQRYLVSSIIRHKEGLHVRIVSEMRPDNDAHLVDSPTLEEAYLNCISYHQ
jgi:ABC-type multidrug transport system ATPase subunit